MLVGKRGHFAAAGGTHDIAFLDEVRLVDLLDGAGILTHCGSNGCETDWTALELVDDGRQDADVHLVKAATVHIESLQGIARNVEGDGAVAFDLCKVAHSTKQQVGNTWSATTATCDFECRLAGNLDIEQRCGARHDMSERLGIVVLQTAGDAKTGTQGGGKHTRTRGGADECEWLKVELHAAGGRAGLNHDIDTVVLHSGIEVLLYDRRETVDFVDKKNIVLS